MLKIMTDELNRYKYVFMHCEHLYYDAKSKVFCCARSATAFDGIIRCKRCRHGTLKAYVSSDHVIDLENLDGELL